MQNALMYYVIEDLTLKLDSCSLIIYVGIEIKAVRVDLFIQ